MLLNWNFLKLMMNEEIQVKKNKNKIGQKQTIVSTLID